MSLKSFLLKKTLQMKGVSKEQAETMAERLTSDPSIAEKLKVLQENKEVKSLFENIQKEIEAKTKSGMPEAYATMNVMTKYKEQIAKHREELMPLMQLMQSVQGK
jgi:cell fate (sporulation/competence/biofilm development) regulator YlbF (YheA/YmcA/DUF963 family)